MSNHQSSFAPISLPHVQRFLEALGPSVTPISSGGWDALCPAHDDHTPSLHVDVGDNGSVICDCRSRKCSKEAIVAAIGLTMRDLYPPGDTSPRRGRGRPPKTATPKPTSGGDDSQSGSRRSNRSANSETDEPTADQREVARFDYLDAAGKLAYQAIRFEPGANGRSKDFKLRRPVGKRIAPGPRTIPPTIEPIWDYHVKGHVPLILYRLNEIVTADPGSTVYIAEGEGKAEAMRRLGLLATCNPMGAGKWSVLDQSLTARVLAPHRVVILPDNDQSGFDHARDVAGRLLSSVTPPSGGVLILELPGLDRKGDVIDWIAAGPENDGNAIAAMVHTRAVDAGGWAPPKGPTTATTTTPPPPNSNEPTTTAHFSNFSYTVDENDKKKRFGLSASAIRSSLTAQSGDWPRRIGSALFVPDGDRGPLWLKTPSDVFAWIQQIYNSNEANLIEWTDKGTDTVSRSEFAAYLRQQSTRYEAVESVPHEPPIPGHFYIHPELPPSNGKHIDGLLSRFAPATPHDNSLIMAMLLTFVWGGPYGARQGFLLSGTEGDRQMNRGIGKTTLVKLCARLFGGTFDIRPTDDWAKLTTRLLGGDTTAATQRVILIDNVKTSRFSSADLEALITNDRISGHKMYVGDGSRPNIFTVCVTMNGASLSKDLAQRFIPIQLKRPSYSGNWETEAAEYIDAHRWEIIAELIAHLRRPANDLPSVSRWGAWDSQILARLPRPEALQELIQQRREEIDDDNHEAMILRQEIVKELRIRRHGKPHPDSELDDTTDLDFGADRDEWNVDRICVRIPADVMTQILCSAFNDRFTTTAMGTKVKAMAGAIPELRFARRDGHSTYFWTGKHCDPGTIAEKLNERPSYV